MDYTKLGITPIDEQNPAGDDVKYDEDFELIESEMAKLTSPSASGEIDWDKVSKLSYTILETKSKNILVAVYLSYALYKLRGIDGLEDGVGVIADILENYWETLYPPKRRLKGRINAIEWWLNKVSKDLQNIEDVECDSDKKDVLVANLKKIDEFLNEQIDDAPLFFSLIKLLDMKLVTQTKEEVVEQITTQTATKETPKPKNVVKPTKTLSANVEDDFSDAVESLNMLIGQMIEAKDYRSELFMINRAFTWLDIDELPSSEKNITMLPPPDAQEIELLNSLYKEKNYEVLLWSAESRISTYLFWLDLHFFVAQSLKHLKQTQASDVVYEQVEYFIKKLPNLQNLSFSDSTPFASKETKKWLKPKELKKDNSLHVEEKEQGLSDISIDVLSTKMRSSLSVEEEVSYNIQICKKVLENKNSTLIYTYTHKLLDTIEEYLTARWSPKTAIDAYSISVECLKEIDDEQSKKLIESLLVKIALLKPSMIDELS